MKVRVKPYLKAEFTAVLIAVLKEAETGVSDRPGAS
jgi:hypothetical protein